jgi:hypothetical protein
MERKTQWRAGPSRASRVYRQGPGRRRLRAAAAAGALVAVTMPVLSSDAAVGGLRSIEVFPDSDVVLLAGYPPNTNVKVEVVRHGFVVGYTTRLTDSIGGFEINHAGGLAGDCFDSPTSPDIQPTDKIRATVLEPGGVTDTSVVRGVWIDEMDFSNTTITASGHVSLTGPDAVNPATDVLELRIEKDNPWDVTPTPGRDDRRELITADVQTDGTWTHELTASVADVVEARDAEIFLEWSNAGSTELTVTEFGVPEPVVGCPPAPSGPTAPLLLRSDDTGKVGDHITSKATDLTFSGLAGTGVVGDPGPGETVTLQVDGVDRAQTTANAKGVYRFTGINLKSRSTPHTVRVLAPGQLHAQRRVTVDAKTPSVRVRSFRPTPLHLTGPEKLRVVYVLSEGASLVYRIDRVDPSSTLRAFAKRKAASSGPVEFTWAGKNKLGKDVRPGRYRLVLTVTDKAGNVTVQSDPVRVVR